MLDFIFDWIMLEILDRLPKPVRIGCYALMVLFLVTLFAWLLFR